MIPDRQSVILKQIEEKNSHLTDPDENIRRQAKIDLQNLHKDYVDQIISVARNKDPDISRNLISIKQHNQQPNHRKHHNKPIGGGHSRIHSDHLSKDELEIELMETILSFGGQGKKRYIEVEMERRLKGKLTPTDLELISGTPRWKEWLGWCRQDFVERGIFKNDSELGIWELETKLLTKKSETIKKLRYLIEENLDNVIRIRAFKVWLGHKDAVEEIPALLRITGNRLDLIGLTIEYLNAGKFDENDLLPFLNSDIEGFRLAAIKKLKNPLINPEIIKKLGYFILQDANDEIRIQAFEVWLKQKDLVEVIPSLLKISENRLDLTNYAIEWMNEIEWMNNRKFDENDLLPFLTIEINGLRLSAIRKLKKTIINPETITKLRYLIEQDASDEIRIQAFKVWLRQKDLTVEIPSLLKITENRLDLTKYAIEWLNEKFDENDLLPFLTINNEDFRLIAIKKLKTPIVNPETITKLRYLIEQDTNDEIRIQAFKVWLKQKDSVEEISYLLKITEDRLDLAKYAIEWLNDQKFEDSDLLYFLHIDMDSLRLAAIKKLKNPITNPKIVTKLINLLEQDPNNEIRIHSLDCLLQQGNSIKKQSILIALKDDDNNIRLQACEKAALFNDEQFIEPLIEIYCSTSDSRIKSLTVNSLGKINNKIAVIPKIKASNRDPEIVEHLHQDLNAYILSHLKWR